MSDIRLIYKSTPSNYFSGAAIDDILACSRRHNAEQHISGVLYFSRYFLFQVLEGEVTEVNALYNRITADKRHTDCVLLDYRHITERHFTDWSMGYIAENIAIKKLFKLPRLTDKIDFFNYTQGELLNIIDALKEELKMAR